MMFRVNYIHDIQGQVQHDVQGQEHSQLLRSRTYKMLKVKDIPDIQGQGHS